MSIAEIALYGMGLTCFISFCQMLCTRQDKVELAIMGSCAGFLLLGGVAA